VQRPDEETTLQQRQVAWLRKELALVRDERDALRGVRDENERLHAALSDAAERTARLQEALDAFLAERGDLLEDARRLRGSRSWRYGHAVMRVAGRLTRRSLKDEGAADAMVGRLRTPPPEVAVADSAPAGLLAPPAVVVQRDPGAVDLERLAAVPCVTVIVPVHDAFDEVERCLESVRRNTGRIGRLLLIDDASTDPRITQLLAAEAQHDNVTVLVNERNLGFTATVNRGFDHADPGGDVIVLNSDTEVPPRWIEQLMLAAYEDRVVGTVTPVSDNAGAFSVPEIDRDNPLPPGVSADEAGRLFAHAARRWRVRTPTGSGFCLYIKRECLDTVGRFDEERFPRGYGEENDFCRRAAELGWTHAVDDATWVHHRREASFGGEKAQLVARNRALLDELYPDYTALVRQFVASPPLRAVQDDARATLRRATDGEDRGLPRLLFVLHVGGGGVPATNADLMRGLADRYECLALTSDGETVRLWQEHEGLLTEIREWVLDSPWQAVDATREDMEAIAREVLMSYGIELVHVRHLFRHTLDVPRIAEMLGVPVVFSFHDFYLSCPTIHLLDEHDRYCAGVCTAGAGDCPVPPTMGAMPWLKHGWIKEWRRRLTPVLQGADALVTTSEHVRFVYRRTYPGIVDVPFALIPHGRDLVQQSGIASPPRADEPIRILVPGNIGEHKGGALLAELKRLDADDRLELHFLGLVPERFADLGVQHGAYDRDHFADRAREIAPSFVAILSITAESYSHTLTEAWAAGIPVLATDLGALRERIGAQGGGWLLAPDDPQEILRRILEIAGDETEYRREQERAVVDETTVAQMAAAYDALYQDAFERRRALSAPAQQPARV
jgi:GT2 family glycosyltransferase/glycosyltransferase involved in cell wall biosynthesis